MFSKLSCVLKYLSKSTYLGLAVLLCLSSAADADVYRYQGADGNAAFQDGPCSENVVAVADVSSDAGPGDQKNFLWQASAGKGTLYLLGSIHFGSPNMYPLPDVVSQAFEHSDSLVVEADVLNVDPMSLAQIIASKAMFSGGETLKEHLSDATWKQLQEAATGLGIPLEMLNMQRPWMVSMTLTALELNKLGYSEDLGIDQHFLMKANGNKEIIELEGLEWQLGLFEHLSIEEQVAMLEQTLAELDQGREFFDRLLRAWKVGDAAEIEALFDEGFSKNDPVATRLNQVIMLDRNRSMSKSLQQLADKGGTHFVVVGAGHMVGEDGIVSLLKQRGYVVKQL